MRASALAPVLGACVLGVCVSARAGAQLPATTQSPLTAPSPQPQTAQPQTAQPQTGQPQTPPTTQSPETSAPQTQPPQGSAVFGAAEGRGLPERAERFDLLVQTFGGYDDDVLAQQTGGGAPSQQRLASSAAGLATGMGALLTYTHPGLLFRRPDAKGDFRLWTDNSFRYYPGLDNLVGRYHRFGLQMSAPIARRVTLFVSPRADYAPRYSFELLQQQLPSDPETGQIAFSTDATGSEADYSVISNNSFRYGVIGGAEIGLGSRSSVTFDGGYARRQSDIAAFDMEIKHGGVKLDHQFTRNIGLDLGYSYIDGNHGSGLTARAHNLDIGIDYRRPLSRTRRTYLTFNTGSTIAESELRGRRVLAIGSATLTHQIGRTWTAVGEYRRRLHYVDGFDRPLFGDAITAGVHGLVTRSTELSFRASYTTGTVGLSGNAPRFDSAIASARMRRALSRRIAGYAEALYYHYEFDENAVRAPGLPRMFDRVAIRFGLNWWIPLVQ